MFTQYDVEDDYLNQVRLASTSEIIKGYAYLLPCDVYRGLSFGKYQDAGTPDDPNINA